jgi:hypothetical protein
LTIIFREPYTTEVDGECTEKHLATLKRRYDERRLREAASRRAHLDCQRIAIGAASGSGRVKLLLAQMHHAYYFGFAESACILAGTVVEQALIHRLGMLQDLRGPLAFASNGRRAWLSDRHDLLDLELVDMLELAKAEGALRSGRVLLLAHEIRWIRNSVVHESIPLFRPADERFLELTVAKSRKGRPRHATVRLERAEVSGLVGNGAAAGGPRAARQGRALPAQVTAYFCVSRARMILQNLFTETESEGRKRDESGGSLLLWQES